MDPNFPKALVGLDPELWVRPISSGYASLDAFTCTAVYAMRSSKHAIIGQTHNPKPYPEVHIQVNFSETTKGFLPEQGIQDRAPYRDSSITERGISLPG